MQNIQRIALLGLCILLLFAISGCNNPNKSEMKFDHDKWITKGDMEWTFRKDIVQDLLDSKILIGKSKEDVIEMLGTPEDFTDVKSNEMYYTIETDYGWDIDPVKIEYLIVTLDSKEKVTSAYRTTIKCN